jgi:hypothetical protein
VPFLDLERLEAAQLNCDPFDFVIVDNFVRAEHLQALMTDFPQVKGHGSFPLGAVSCGTVFSAFAEELEGEDLRRAVEEKFAIDLAGRPTMITVRGRSDGKDGRIHTDSATKLITLLLYMNLGWDAEAGRLQLVRCADDLANYVAQRANIDFLDARRAKQGPGDGGNFFHQDRAIAYVKIDKRA